MDSMLAFSVFKSAPGPQPSSVIVFSSPSVSAGPELGLFVISAAVKPKTPGKPGVELLRLSLQSTQGRELLPLHTEVATVFSSV